MFRPTSDDGRRHQDQLAAIFERSISREISGDQSPGLPRLGAWGLHDLFDGRHDRACHGSGREPEHDRYREPDKRPTMWTVRHAAVRRRPEFGHLRCR
jgi:hypothetical protein